MLPLQIQPDVSLRILLLVVQPNPLQAAVRISEISCFGASDGILEAIGSGGTAPYSYQWLDGSVDLGQDSVIMNLGASANYQLKVTDANGCESLAFASLSEPTEIDILTSTVTPAYCEDVATGGISVIATGGTLQNDSDYSYAWDNSGSFQQLTNILTNQEAGDYTVTVTDDNGCQQSKTINLPLQPTLKVPQAHQKLLVTEVMMVVLLLLHRVDLPLLIRVYLQ